MRRNEPQSEDRPERIQHGAPWHAALVPTLRRQARRYVARVHSVRDMSTHVVRRSLPTPLCCGCALRRPHSPRFHSTRRARGGVSRTRPVDGRAFSTAACAFLWWYRSLLRPIERAFCCCCCYCYTSEADLWPRDCVEHARRPLSAYLLSPSVLFMAGRCTPTCGLT